MGKIEFNKDNETFVVTDPEKYTGVYFPLAGEQGLKSAITPTLGGDSKLDQNHFLLEPVSIENLHNNRASRNFWVRVEKKGYWSACGNSAEQEYQKFGPFQDESILEAGFMWQKVKRTSRKYELEARITSFVTVDGAMEVMMVELTNQSYKEQIITPIAAIPVYGRSADNLRDHRHVTSLLHRIHTCDYGVVTRPVLSFDERGHQKNDRAYYVCALTENGEKPSEFYPTVESFIGEGGSFLIPEAVRDEKRGYQARADLEGKEAVGGIRFEKVIIRPQETKCYIVLMGTSVSENEMNENILAYRTKEQVEEKLTELKKYWSDQVNVDYKMENEKTDAYLKWISFQPILRRIYGCSFLPYHDYGKGGRGWRDLWQDCLALLMMNPSKVRQMILDNFGGVRIDGTNATIIGSKQGEFIADRNNIARVWMDHAFWPFVTTNLYLNQTGDFSLLLEDATYFKDVQAMRGTEKDIHWMAEDGNRQKTSMKEIYYGSVLEHILIQNLCAFYDVGEHNIMKLHGADWNDALDMADKHGESVAFTCAYAGNLADIAGCLERLRDQNGIKYIHVSEEMKILLSLDANKYDSVEEKNHILDGYTQKVFHHVTGEKISLDIDDLIDNLKEKSQWMMNHIRKQEWVEDESGNGWFNGYYDNHGNQVEGISGESVRMMLTGQVFAIMSGTATKEQIEKISQSADKYLYEKKAGGYRLNTNFHEEKFDLGRMFGFAYGEKENGAVFSHMTVMYANALYKQGFVEEGYKALQSLLDSAMDYEHSKMFPGIPEYFNTEGRGMYPYLTGAASWYMLTMITEVFGIKGNRGELLLEPKLMKQQFSENKTSSIRLNFMGKKFYIRYENLMGKEYGTYEVIKAVCNGENLPLNEAGAAVLGRNMLAGLDSEKENLIVITLE